MSKKPIVIMIILSALLATPAYAYLNPGTGSVLVQGLLAGAGSALVVVKIYWQRLKSIVMRWFQKTPSGELQKKNHGEGPSE